MAKKKKGGGERIGGKERKCGAVVQTIGVAGPFLIAPLCGKSDPCSLGGGQGNIEKSEGTDEIVLSVFPLKR